MNRGWAHGKKARGTSTWKSWSEWKRRAASFEFGLEEQQPHVLDQYQKHGDIKVTKFERQSSAAVWHKHPLDDSSGHVESPEVVTGYEEEDWGALPLWDFDRARLAPCRGPRLRWPAAALPWHWPSPSVSFVLL